MKIISQILLLSLIFVISCDKDSVSSDEEESSPIIGVWKMKWYRSIGGTEWNILPSYETDGFIVDIRPDGEFRWITMGDGDTLGIQSKYYQKCDYKNRFEFYWNLNFDVYSDSLSTNTEPNWVWWDSTYNFEFDSTIFTLESVCDCSINYTISNDLTSHIEYS